MDADNVGQRFQPVWAGGNNRRKPFQWAGKMPALLFKSRAMPNMRTGFNAKTPRRKSRKDFIR
jgi:hypothetical protein